MLLIMSLIILSLSIPIMMAIWSIWESDRL